MNKQEVIDYVMSTPHNVNRTILSQSLDEIGTQADWNQNDPTKPDYVKNRTHYTESTQSALFYEGSVKTEDGWAEVSLNYTLVEGATYRAMFDGNSYELICKAYEWGENRYPYIGSESLATNQEAWTDSEPPFYVEEGWLYTNLAEGNHTLRVEGYAEIAHKIDKKYLPDTVLHDTDNLGDMSVRVLDLSSFSSVKFGEVDFFYMFEETGPR